MDQYNVIDPKLDDIPKYVEMGAKMHKESVFRSLTYDPAKIERISEAVILGLDPNIFAKIIETADGEPVGIFLAMCNETYFGPDKVTNDLLMYLAPEHRTHCFPQLMTIADAYKDWAFDDRGAKMCHLSQSSQIDVDKIEKVFELLGFPKSGTLHTIIDGE